MRRIPNVLLGTAIAGAVGLAALTANAVGRDGFDDSVGSSATPSVTSASPSTTPSSDDSRTASPSPSGSPSASSSGTASVTGDDDVDELIALLLAHLQRTGATPWVDTPPSPAASASPSDGWVGDAGDDHGGELDRDLRTEPGDDRDGRSGGDDDDRSGRSGGDDDDHDDDHDDDQDDDRGSDDD